MECRQCGAVFWGALEELEEGGGVLDATVQWVERARVRASELQKWR